MAHKPKMLVVDAEWNVGDAAYLRSGSQRMVVEKVLGDGLVQVVWMVYETAQMLRDILPVAVLKKAHSYQGPAQ